MIYISGSNLIINMRKEFLLFGILTVIMVVSGCIQTGENAGKPSGTRDLVLNEQDLGQLGMTGDVNECRTEGYETGEHSTLAQYSFCNYTISSLNGTRVILEVKKFTNMEDLNGSYQYDSSHYFSAEGLISENEYGDQSRFRVNSEKDYGGEYNKPGVYYYHLWICKDLYLIHITSSGRSEEAGEYVPEMGRLILSEFG